MTDELRLLGAFALALIGARISVPLAIRLAWRTSFFDRPAGYKAHAQPTPYLGGAAVMVAFLVPALLFGGGASDYLVVVLGAVALMALGTVDDRIGVSPTVRVLVEIMLAVLVWRAGLGWEVFQGDGANLMLTVLWVVGLVNAFNLMDNMDGAAGTVATVSGGGIALLAFAEGQPVLAALMLALVGACMGFLPFNLSSPSRIFLGDGGSMPIGFMAAAGLMVMGSEQAIGLMAVLAVVPLVGLPILDTTLVVISRLRRRAQVLSGAQDHLTHRLRERLPSAQRVVGILAVGQAASCALAVALLSSDTGLIAGGAVSYLLVGAVAIGLLETGHTPLQAGAPVEAATVENPRIRVLRVIARLNMGGPAHHVSLLSGMLDRDRYETLLLHGEVGAGEASLADVAERWGARTRTVPGLRPDISPLNDLRAFVALVREMRAFKPDIVHTHTAKAGMLGRLAVLVALHPRPVVVHTYHGHVLEGYFGRVKNAAYRRIETALARVSDRLIGVSTATVDDLVRLGVAPRSKFTVVPVGLDLEPFFCLEPADGESFRNEVGAAPDEVLLTFVGRLVPIKRVDMLLRAVARARALGAPVRLAVVGDGELRGSLEGLAAELGIAHSVTFAGYRADVAPVAAAADIAVLSSDNEGTPVSLIEAAAAGRCAAATAVGGVAEVVTPESGLLVERGDAEGLGEAIARLADDPRARAQMGGYARAHTAERFVVERLLRNADGLYRELMSGSGGTSEPDPLLQPTPLSLAHPGGSPVPHSQRPAA